MYDFNIDVNRTPYGEPDLIAEDDYRIIGDDGEEVYDDNYDKDFGMVD